MNPSFHRFVDKIVKQTAGNQTEKDDLYEELMIHLEMSREQFIIEAENTRDFNREMNRLRSFQLE